jgi:hypothetical protein
MVLNYINPRALSGKIDQPKKKETAGGNSAFNKFKQMDSRNQQTNADTEVLTTHQNTISTVLKHVSGNGLLECKE